ncbi:MAG: Ig-like domain-containing protein [Sphingobacteriales bacterium]|nr:Ig-like domain-containing protein [Sphingobacteriales bacterium]
MAAFFIVFLGACAKIMPPEGGDKDTTPPAAAAFKPPQGSTSFNASKIEIQFDEYVQLGNTDAIIVSPPTEQRWNYQLKGKTFLITPPDDLAANTTYTLQFNDVIKDFTEGNTWESSDFVFSTGVDIVGGKVCGVLDATNVQKKESTGAASNRFLVGLYQWSSDSLFISQRPLYYTLAQPADTFHLLHIAPGEYRLVALEDKNNSNFYDQPEENIAFYGEKILVTADTTCLEIGKISLFNEKNALVKVKEIKNRRHKATVTLSAAADSMKAQALQNDSLLVMYPSEKKDTLLLWFKGDVAATEVLLHINAQTPDTLKVENAKKDTTSLPEWKITSNIVKTRNNTFKHLYQHLSIKYPFPLKEIQNFAFSIKEKDDTLAYQQYQVLMNVDYPQEIKIDYDWKPETSYEVLIREGGISDIFNRRNPQNDTLRFTTRRASDYGALRVELKNIPAATAVLELIDGFGTRIDSKIPAADNSAVFERLQTGVYNVRVVIDENHNGKWDTGNFAARKQPERVLTFPESITIKPNWETLVIIEE